MTQRTCLSDDMFITEKQLVQVLKSNYSTMCDWNIQERNTFLSEEVDLGFGIADLVISKVKTVINSNVTLNNLDIALYNAIRDNQSIDNQDLVLITHINANLVKKSITKLIEYNLIHLRDDKYKINDRYEEITIKNIAIEAKLKNWRRALSQAFRYKWFACETYVVMDSFYVHTAVKKIDEFIKLNVGLAEINTNGVVIMHYKPNEEVPYNNNMAMILNEKIKESLFASQI